MQRRFSIYTLKNIETAKHQNVPLELKDYIDFEVKRVYFITNITGETGAHCHKIEKELFVMVKGSCTAVIDQGGGIEAISMNGSLTAIYVPNLVWHQFKDFSKDAILLALSSTNYNPDRSDYIEDYDEFKQIREEINNEEK